MKAATVVFDYDDKDRYERLLDVFLESIRENSPAVEPVVIRMPAPMERRANIGFTSNHHKFKAWLEFAREQVDPFVLMDCDMIVTGNLADAFAYDFDIGITRRTKANWPYNGGVVFVKPTAEAIAFIEAWAEADARMYADSTFHQTWRNVYKGMNQASLGYTLEENNPGAKVRDFPCAIWNACNEDWAKITDATRVIHVKSNLRKAVLGEAGPYMPSKLHAAVRIFKRYEAQARKRKGSV
jgi:hypothetical protein